MTLNNYVESFLPERYTILGIELKELSLGHYFLMRRFNVGYACDNDTNVGWDDFVVALLICSMSYNDFVDLMNNRVGGKPAKHKWLYWLDNQKHFISFLTHNGRLLKKRINKDKHFNMLVALKQFSQYLDNSTKMPKYWDKEESNTSNSGAHWSQTIFTTAISDLGYTRDEALNVPLRQLFNDFFKFAESQGAIELMTEDEEQEIAELEKQ